ncbi:conjugative transfer protein [Escherichia coli]|uniref:Conjugative transfer protein n=1 Tax=Escherichia coli TaxID=562 RepID=A0A376KH44_ECOLX|nr:conjugative transfer protein [Escherichia coli]
MNGLKLVFSVTAPVTGTVESASLSVYAAFFFLNSRYTFMNTTFNVGLANGQSDTYPLSGATGLQVTQGQVLTGSAVLLTVIASRTGMVTGKSMNRLSVGLPPLR